MNRFLFIFSFLIIFAYQVSGEEVVSTKKEEPDAYYGLKIGAIVTPTVSVRIRDKASGTTDLNASDRSGFSLPWTMFFISKEWEDTGLKMEFWGEIVRSDVLSNDTTVNGGTKSNPYVFAVRRANVSKTIELGQTQHKFQFGMFELPHMFSVWSGYYDWRYFDRSPLESLGFAKDPVDLGINYIGSWKSLSVQTAVVNGEGYRSVQNTNGTGYDVILKLSWEERWSDTLKSGLHFLGRRSNAFGYAGDECKEGRTNCLPSDGNPLTVKRGSISLTQEQVYAVEANLIWKEFANVGLGGMAKKQFGGRISDSLDPFGPSVMIPEKIGRGGYLWLGLGNSLLRLVMRGEVATGGPNPGLTATESSQREPWVRFKDPATNPIHSDQSHYILRQIFLEWFLTPSARMALGYTETRSFDAQGEPNKWYVDNSGMERNRVEYIEQFSKPTLVPISEYGRLDRNIVIKATATF
ncbi:hypothetical protein P3G55_12425 [Leptospira sp. 96542]|nr:hypothetical protein [Leptospira sp. 96542]